MTTRHYGKVLKRFKLITGLSLAFIYTLLPLRALATVVVTDCVIIAPPANTPVTSAYLKIAYSLDEKTAQLYLPTPETLQRIEINELSDDVQIHESQASNGVVEMIRHPSLRLPEPELRFSPGGYHLMLTDLKKQPQPGERYKMVLLFTFEPEQQCLAEVKSINDVLLPTGQQTNNHH